MNALRLSGLVFLTLACHFLYAGGSLIKKEDVPKTIEILKMSPKAQERAKAAEQLGKRGAVRVTDVLDALMPLRDAATKDRDNTVRRSAIIALGNIAREPEETVPLLTKALSDKDTKLQLAAIMALANYGPEARSALPELKKLNANADKQLAQAIKEATKAINATKKKN